MLKAHLDPTWDAASRNHAFIAKSVDWITQIAPPMQYMKLLDLGCGPGLYAERFNTKGYEVTGIDYSHRSLDYARNSALQNGSDITYIYQDYPGNPAQVCVPAQEYMPNFKPFSCI
jgi:2-polyprenyl-3-methyl-5-hydroxy-6-metoxy-1,4-benzoquinol methylase